MSNPVYAGLAKLSHGLLKLQQKILYSNLVHNMHIKGSLVKIHIKMQENQISRAIFFGVGQDTIICGVNHPTELSYWYSSY